ncbi:MAG: RAD55 family ATPase, partial [Candidatus Nitrosocosmicus sp.]
MQIPGLHNLTGKDAIPETIFILTGNSGVGKSVYCRNFYLDGLSSGDYCIYIDCLSNSIDFEQKFSNVEKNVFCQNSLFINPYKIKGQKEQKLNKTLDELTIAIESKLNTFDNNKSKHIRVVVDSLTHLLILFNEKVAEDFIKDLYFLLKTNNAIGIFTNTVPSVNEFVVSRLTCLFDGIIEMRLEDKNINSHDNSNSSIQRKMRILSIKNIAHNPHWVQFEITDEGNI